MGFRSLKVADIPRGHASSIGFPPNPARLAKRRIDDAAMSMLAIIAACGTAIGHDRRQAGGRAMLNRCVTIARTWSSGGIAEGMADVAIETRRCAPLGDA
ncbi:MAG: hypothetical protein KA144_00235 [Xanthomonadaceae bacterium]|nr:hypothetical protein [Xanthomonadaceae bacterium]